VDRAAYREEETVQDAGQDDRLTVADASERLGISKEAVRKRISRETLRADKDPDGTVRVYVPASGTAAATFDRDELIAELRARIEDLRTDRDAWRDQARRSDYMASAALDRTRELEGRLRELEAPAAPDERESPEKAGERPEGVEDATGGAQEGIERPQQRSGWLAPVDKLPWWHYGLGLLLVFLSAITAIRPVGVTAALVPPSIFGFWVGFRQKDLRLWPRVIRFGVLVGVADSLGVVGFMIGLLLALRLFIGSLPADEVANFLPSAFYIVAPFFSGWLLYVSGTLIGNALQRLRTGLMSGTTPVSPLSRTTPASPESHTNWTPRKQAMLGLAGSVIAALIGLIGNLLTQ